MQYIDDENNETHEVELSNMADWIKYTNPISTISNDPFKLEGEDLRKVEGLSPTFRRKMGRDLQKRFIGKDGAETQQNLLAQAITGYAMFDLIEPPYNLEYLSKIYEISPYNYSAINAKVANIVGLGYDFVESKKTIEAMEAIDDEVQLARARRKLDKIGRAHV